jgi:hypothetical protein
MDLLAKNKGRPMQGIVEQVRDGSTVRVYLLPDFQFVQVFVAGIQVWLLHSVLHFPYMLSCSFPVSLICCCQRILIKYLTFKTY